MVIRNHTTVLTGLIKFHSLHQRQMVMHSCLHWGVAPNFEGAPCIRHFTPRLFKYCGLLPPSSDKCSHSQKVLCVPPLLGGHHLSPEYQEITPFSCFSWVCLGNTFSSFQCFIFIALIQQTNTLNVFFLKEYEILPKAWLLFDYHSFPRDVCLLILISLALRMGLKWNKQAIDVWWKKEWVNGAWMATGFVGIDWGM